MYYFASDQHMGLKGCGDPTEREKRIVRWLDAVANDAKAIFLLGDLFDFWWEYKRVIPKGHSRLLGKLSELNDRGVEIHLFKGNHDLWAFGYLADECGVILHDKEEVIVLDGKRVFMAHGDNLLTGSWIVSFMNSGFRTKWLQMLFMLLFHPNWAIKLGMWWSGKSRKSKSIVHTFRGEEEYLVRFARKYLEDHKVDYFVFGHIHVAEDYDLGGGARAIFLGEWIEKPTYAQMINGEITLKNFE